MNKNILAFLVGLSIAAGTPAAAAPYSRTVWHRFCESLLHATLERQNSGPKIPDMKLKYNREVLARSRANYISATQPYVRHLAGNSERLAFIHEMSMTAVDRLLDGNLPHWWSDGDWYFQPAHEISLYAASSAELLSFEEDTIVLMNGAWAFGRIVLSERPVIDLF